MLMKKVLLVTVLGTSIANMLIAAPALRGAQATKPAAEATKQSAAVTPTSAAVLGESDKKYLEAIGWKMGTQSLEAARDTLGLTDAEKKYVIQGMKNGIDGKPSPIDFKVENDKIIGYMDSKTKVENERKQAIIAMEATQNKEIAKAYFDNLAKDAQVKKTSSGLYYQIIKESTGPKPTETSTVKIEYTGKLINGNKFDSSKDRGEPATFNLQQVIPGIREGLQLVGKGGSIRLYIPSALGYGDHNLQGIPAGSTLIFDVDMLDIVTDDKKT
jgi:FKBP-type peptidyl-prolyl cis-trans isomerase FkpA